MNTSKNKIILLIAGAFCMSALAFVGVQVVKNSKLINAPVKNQERSNNNSDNNNSNEAVGDQSSESCDDKIRDMSNEDLVKYVLNISDNAGTNSSQVKKRDYDEYVLVRYLGCQYKGSSDEQEKNKIFSEMEPVFDSMFAAAGSGISNMAKKSFKNQEESFIDSLALSDFSKLCPSELPKMCKQENGTLFIESAGWCDDICTKLTSYKNDTDAFNREVTNLSNLDASSSGKFPAYVWRVALTFGLKGKDEALKFCDSIPVDVRYPCIVKVNSYEIREISCDDIAGKLEAELCSN